MKKDYDFKLLRGFVVNGLTDICESRVAFATEKSISEISQNEATEAGDGSK